jgi:hypothetical protein
MLVGAGHHGAAHHAVHLGAWHSDGGDGVGAHLDVAGAAALAHDVPGVALHATQPKTSTKASAKNQMCIFDIFSLPQIERSSN